MTYPIGYAANPHRNKLIYNEMAYDKEILAAEFNKCYHSLIGMYNIFQFFLKQYSFPTIHTTNS